MRDDDLLQLHDLFARGETLTAEQTARLEAWYAAQDAAEARELSKPLDLYSRVQASLEQVAETARNIQQTMRENDSLRREIAGLRVKLARQSVSR